MDDPPSVSLADATARLDHQIGCTLHRQRTEHCEQPPEVHSVQVLEHHVGGAVVGHPEVDDGSYVLAFERAGGGRLLLESG